MSDPKQVYDSRSETLEHRRVIKNCIAPFILELANRAEKHDESKLHAPEKEIFDEYTPRLASVTYGSDEYKQLLAKMKPALDNHYYFNRHHPEFHNYGITSMTLVDVVEMFADWKAASARHKDGDFMESLLFNRDRFQISDQLYEILVNTAESLGWGKA